MRQGENEARQAGTTAEEHAEADCEAERVEGRAERWVHASILGYAATARKGRSRTRRV